MSESLSVYLPQDRRAALARDETLPHHAQGRMCITRQGGRLRFRLSVPEACVRCGGAGSSSFHPCAVCRGSGAVKEQMQVEMSFPPGMRDGQRSHLSPTSLGIPHLHLSLTFTIHGVFL